MPTLMIKNAFGTWKMYVSNSPIEYTFSGADGEAQYLQVQALQDAMTQGTGQVTAELGNILQNIPPGDEPAVVQQLYGASTELYYGETFVYEAVEGSDLLLDMVQAGEALGAFVGAAARSPAGRRSG